MRVQFRRLVGVSDGLPRRFLAILESGRQTPIVKLHEIQRSIVWVISSHEVVHLLRVLLDHVMPRIAFVPLAWVVQVVVGLHGRRLRLESS